MRQSVYGIHSVLCWKEMFQKNTKDLLCFGKRRNMVISERSFMLCMRHKEIVKRHSVEGQMCQCIWEAEAGELKATRATQQDHISRTSKLNAGRIAQCLKGLPDLLQGMGMDLIPSTHIGWLTP